MNFGKGQPKILDGFSNDNETALCRKLQIISRFLQIFPQILWESLCFLMRAFVFILINYMVRRFLPVQTTLSLSKFNLLPLRPSTMVGQRIFTDHSLAPQLEHFMRFCIGHSTAPKHGSLDVDSLSLLSTFAPTHYLSQPLRFTLDWLASCWAAGSCWEI